ncbi:MAG: hypothetical protein K6G08_06340, partial [Prevotella sp.]|nr:hypothetical protein [Prevotella sp.]
ELTRTSDTITYDPLDWKGVGMAVENLRHNLKAVTGSANAPIVVGPEDLRIVVPVPMIGCTSSFWGQNAAICAIYEVKTQNK